MNDSEIKVGGYYLARVNDKIVTVHVDAIRNAFGCFGDSSRLRYDITIIATGRKMTLRSASKFRGETHAPHVVVYGDPTDCP